MVLDLASCGASSLPPFVNPRSSTGCTYSRRIFRPAKTRSFFGGKNLHAFWHDVRCDLDLWLFGLENSDTL